MSVVHDYPVTVTWNEQKIGTLTADGIPLHIKVATPPEFDGGHEGIWSPEHLFTAAVSSCLMTTFLAIAKNSNLVFTNFTCESSGHLELADGKYRMTSVTLRPVVTLVNADDEQKAMRVLQKAEANCLISNSITSKIFFEPRVEFAEAVMKD